MSDSFRLKKILQIVPAAAGWRIGTPDEDTHKVGNEWVPYDPPRWTVEEEPIPCFALCSVSFLNEAGEEDGDPFEDVYPMRNGGDTLMEVVTEDRMGKGRLIGPGFRAGRVPPKMNGWFPILKAELDED